MKTTPSFHSLNKRQDRVLVSAYNVLQETMKSFAVTAILLLQFPITVSCFKMLQPTMASHRRSSSSPHPAVVMLRMADISITNPSPDDAANMGIRDWPQQVKKGYWEERCTEGEPPLVRYVLDGTGTLDISTSSYDTNNLKKTSQVLSPGTLIEISNVEEGESVTLFWKVDTSEGDDMIILTPGFEQGGIFVGAIVAMILTFVALIVGAG